MKIDVPKGHQIGMKVPHGGSDCAKCTYVSDDQKKCSQEQFVEWNGGATLPEPATDYCCDMFQPAKAKTLSDQLRAQKAKR